MGRLDYQDDRHRNETKTREFLWQASANLNNKSASIFTGILPNLYEPPLDEMCWDANCDSEPIMDDPILDESNVEKIVNDYLDITYDQARVYKTSNLIVTFSGDFKYTNARRYFKNIDKLIYHVNRRQETNNSKVNVFYSTPSCYLYALNRANTTWSVKYDDFFPYADMAHRFWTGFYTSRPALKFNIRQASSYLQNVRQLSVIANLNDSVTEKSIGILGI